uniref:Uncharacterized protein n=1 Tax=Leersia perrieri TaxID=77586 RepID=A0A0D9VP48_9ORYZ
MKKHVSFKFNKLCFLELHILQQQAPRLDLISLFLRASLPASVKNFQEVKAKREYRGKRSSKGKMAIKKEY